MSKPVRWTIRFSGHVQGVGFRQTCCENACPCGITGWVRNRSDGSVELVGEGELPDLKKFVRSVENSTFGEVSDRQIDEAEATGEFPDFRVRH